MLVLLVQQIVGRKLKFESADARWVPPPPAERTLGAAGQQRGRVAAAKQPQNGRKTAATRPAASARSVRQLLAARPSLGDAGLVKRASALAVVCLPPFLRQHDVPEDLCASATPRRGALLLAAGNSWDRNPCLRAPTHARTATAPRPVQSWPMSGERRNPCAPRGGGAQARGLSPWLRATPGIAILVFARPALWRGRLSCCGRVQRAGALLSRVAKRHQLSLPAGEPATLGSAASGAALVGCAGVADSRICAEGSRRTCTAAAQTRTAVSVRRSARARDAR